MNALKRREYLPESIEGSGGIAICIGWFCLACLSPPVILAQFVSKGLAKRRKCRQGRELDQSNERNYSTLRAESTAWSSDGWRSIRFALVGPAESSAPPEHMDCGGCIVKRALFHLLQDEFSRIN